MCYWGIVVRLTYLELFPILTHVPSCLGLKQLIRVRYLVYQEVNYATAFWK